MKAALKRLVHIFTVALVTRRDKEDVENLAGLDELIYAGSHGYIITGPDGLFVEHEESKKIIPQLDQIEKEIEKELKERTEGAQLDCKRYAIGLHFRNARPEDEQVVYEIVNKMIAKHLLEKEYALIRNKFKKHKISAKLHYRMPYEFVDNPQNIHVGEIKQIAQDLEPISMMDTAAIKKLCHVLLLWALDDKKHGNGFGFPFDRPHAEFYRRECLLWEQLNSFQDKCMENKPIFKCIARIIGDLSPLVNDMQCMSAFKVLARKQTVFDNLRQALCIAQPNTTKGLKDTGEDILMGNIEKKRSDL